MTGASEGLHTHTHRDDRRPNTMSELVTGANTGLHTHRDDRRPNTMSGLVTVASTGLHIHTEMTEDLTQYLD